VPIDDRSERISDGIGLGPDISFDGHGQLRNRLVAQIAMSDIGTQRSGASGWP